MLPASEVVMVRRFPGGAEGGAAIRTPCTPDRRAASAARYGGAAYAREPAVRPRACR